VAVLDASGEEVRRYAASRAAAFDVPRRLLGRDRYAVLRACGSTTPRG
jgi:hypothetical protein